MNHGHINPKILKSQFFIDICENIDKLGMFLRSSDENTEKKNKPFSDLSEILGKDSN